MSEAKVSNEQLEAARRGAVSLSEETARAKTMIAQLTVSYRGAGLSGGGPNTRKGSPNPRVAKAQPTSTSTRAQPKPDPEEQKVPLTGDGADESGWWWKQAQTAVDPR